MPKKSAVLTCLTMAKLKMNRRVPNKNVDLLKKNQLNRNRGFRNHICSFICQGILTKRQGGVLSGHQVKLPPIYIIVIKRL